MKKNNKILVTGGAGYIGSHCLISLINNKYEPIVVDNLSNSSRKVLKKIQLITKQKIKFYKFDLRNKKKLSSVFKKHKFDSVLHFAGLKSVKESNANPLLYFNNNVINSINLIETMRNFNVFNLIFSSSACVYNSDEVLPWSEISKTGKTTNAYGTSKYIIERMLMDISKADKRWKIGIARYFNPISNHHSGLIGESPNGIPENLVPYLIKVIREEYSFLNIYGNDYKTKDGTGVRDYIHVSDLAEAHLKLLKYLKRINSFEIFNFGSGKGYSVKEIIKSFYKNEKIKIPYKIKPRRNGDLPIYYTLNTKAKKVLKWEVKKDLNTMTKDICKFIKNSF